MGDRCYISLMLHGPITSTGQLHDACEAIASQGFDGTENSSQALEVCADAVLYEANPFFEMQECNYGDISEVEGTLQSIKVMYSVDQGSGGSYPAAQRAWSPDKGEIEFKVAEEEGLVVNIDELRRVLKADDIKAEVEKLIADAEFATGSTLPDFTVPKNLMRAFAKRAAAKALKLEKAK